MVIKENENRQCPLCNTSTIPKYFKKEDVYFWQCQKCFTSYNIHPLKIEHYNTDIHEVYKENINNIMTVDYGHNMKLFNKSELKKIKNKKFKRCYSFGGGFPKIESYFNTDEIIVYDACADAYKEKKEIFKSLYQIPSTKKIIYNKQLFDSNFIRNLNFENEDIISFVHILEHFPYNEILSIIDSIPIDIPIFVYQPDGKDIKDNWMHISNQHWTLMTGKYFCSKIVEIASSKNQKVKFEFYQEWEDSEDFFTMFIKEKIL